MIQLAVLSVESSTAYYAHNHNRLQVKHKRHVQITLYMNLIVAS